MSRRGRSSIPIPPQNREVVEDTPPPMSILRSSSFLPPASQVLPIIPPDIIEKRIEEIVEEPMRQSVTPSVQERHQSVVTPLVQERHQSALHRFQEEDAKDVARFSRVIGQQAREASELAERLSQDIIGRAPVAEDGLLERSNYEYGTEKVNVSRGLGAGQERERPKTRSHSFKQHNMVRGPEWQEMLKSTSEGGSGSSRKRGPMGQRFGPSRMELEVSPLRSGVKMLTNIFPEATTPSLEDVTRHLNVGHGPRRTRQQNVVLRTAHGEVLFTREDLKAQQGKRRT